MSGAYIRIYRFGIIILCLTVCTITASAEAYYSTHFSYAETAFLTFPTNAKGRMFKNASIGLEILEVTYDGKPVTGVKKVHSSYPDISEVDTGDGELLYFQHIVRLNYCENITTNEGLFSVVRYEVPPDANKIVVLYRVRLPGGGVAGPHTLTSWKYIVDTR